jgi:hypothetical protein
MDKVVRILHCGSVKRTCDYGAVQLENVVPEVLIFRNFPSFAELRDRVKEKMGWTEDGVVVRVEGVYDVGSSNGPRTKHMLCVLCQLEWEIYRDVVMNSEVRSLDIIVSKVADGEKYYNPGIMSPTDLNKAPAENVDSDLPDRAAESPVVVKSDKGEEEEWSRGATPFHGGSDWNHMEFGDVAGTSGALDGDPGETFGCFDGDAKASNRVDVVVSGDDENYE